MKTVLVVDDDNSVRRVMAEMLAILGYEVMTAHNGLDALALFYSGEDQIDLVLTDLRMPVMDGYEFVDRIRNRKPATPIICMSSHSSEPPPIGAAFLPKPFTLADVRDCVNKSLSLVPSMPRSHGEVTR